MGSRGEKALERYLNSACAGLFGLERQTVRDELESNLLERVREFQVMGCSSDVALSKALEEFGAPSRVSRGMQEVYILPNLVKGGAWLSILAMGAYLALSSSVAGPVNVTYDGPCKADCVWMGQSYVSVNSLERELRAQGVKVTRGKTVMTATFPGGAKGLVNIRPNSGGHSEDAIFKRGADVFAPIEGLFRLAYVSELPTYLSSLKNPILSIGKVKLSLENAEQPINVAYQMSSLVAEWLCNSSSKAYGRNPANEKITLCPELSNFNPKAFFSQYRLALGKPHAIYALLLPLSSEPMLNNSNIVILQATYQISVLEADANGVLAFPDTRIWMQGLPSEDSALSTALFTTSTREFANGKSKKALLLELSGRLDFGGQNYKVVSKIPPLEELK